MSGRLVKLKIASRSYSGLADQPVFVTPELREALEKRKRRDGTRAYEALVAQGFRGGKHLIEALRDRFGSSCRVVLTHDASTLSRDEVRISFDDYRNANQAKFFQVYRAAGIDAAASYLNSVFPTEFLLPSAGGPTRSEARRVLGDLPAAASALPKRQQAEIPTQIAALIDKQGVDFVFKLLSSIDESLQGASGRIREAFREVIDRLAREPAKAINELADLMDQWNLLQVTSLLSVVKSRLDSIANFEELIHDEATFELKEDRSIHRTLERSMWLLNDEYWIAQSNRSLRTFIGDGLAKHDKVKYGKRRPDFACVNSTGRVILVEIKRPSIALGEEEINQAELYLRIVRKYKSGTKKPLIYLIGNTISEEAREIEEMRGYPTLYTYQDMLDGSRQRYQEYLRIVEDKGD